MRKFDKKKFDAKNTYLKEHIYKGLNNLNTGWDAPSIYYFNEADFEIVLERVEKLGLGLWGIEVWLNDEYHDLRLYDEYSDKPTDNWWKIAFSEFKYEDERHLQYSATYFTPHLDTPKYTLCKI